MESNPHEPPKTRISPAPGGRSRWKRVCLAGLGAAVLFRAIGTLLALGTKDLGDATWYLILNGLVALGELIGWTLACVGGIGWVLGRRRPAAEDPPRS